MNITHITSLKDKTVQVTISSKFNSRLVAKNIALAYLANNELRVDFSHDLYTNIAKCVKVSKVSYDYTYYTSDIIMTFPLKDKIANKLISKYSLVSDFDKNILANEVTNDTLKISDLVYKINKLNSLSVEIYSALIHENKLSVSYKLKELKDYDIYNLELLDEKLIKIDTDDTILLSLDIDISSIVDNFTSSFYDITDMFKHKEELTMFRITKLTNTEDILSIKHNHINKQTRIIQTGFDV